MSGLWKFLVGGIVGGLIGFLVSPKRAREVRDGLMAGDIGRGVRLRAPDRPRLAPALPVNQDQEPETPEEWSETPIEITANGTASGSDILVSDETTLATPETEEEPDASAAERPSAEELSVVATVVPEPQSAVGAPTDALEARIAETKRRLREAQEAMLMAEQPSEAGLDEAASLAEEEEAKAEEAEAEEAPEVEDPTPLLEREAPEDLRARIEETRRRIKEELDQSFDVKPSGRLLPSSDGEPGILEGEVPALGEEAEPPAGSEGHEYQEGAAASEEVSLPLEETTVSIEEVDDLPEVIESQAGTASVSVPAEEPGSDVGLNAAFESVFRPSADEEIEQPAVAAAEEGTGSAEEGPASFDYEAMRQRIEDTRSRLKSKAFDAMMAGETALLEKSAEGAATLPVMMPLIDEEVEETVESTLKEEEF